MDFVPLQKLSHVHFRISRRRPVDGLAGMTFAKMLNKPGETYATIQDCVFDALLAHCGHFL